MAEKTTKPSDAPEGMAVVKTGRDCKVAYQGRITYALTKGENLVPKHRAEDLQSRVNKYGFDKAESDSSIPPAEATEEEILAYLKGLEKAPEKKPTVAVVSEAIEKQATGKAIEAAWKDFTAE